MAKKTEHDLPKQDDKPAAPVFEIIPIDSIKIEGRHRKDMGDLDLLAWEIAQLGLLQPIVVKPDYTLIAGERRVLAFKLLGRTEIPAHVVALDDIVEGEFVENAFRKNFTPSEVVAIASKLKPDLDEKAKQRQKEAGRVGGKAAGKGRPKAEGGVNFTDPYKGKTRDRIAALTGMSFATLDKASMIVAAAERDPERYADLKDRMDKTKKVHPVHKKLLQRLEEDGETLDALKGPKHSESSGKMRRKPARSSISPMKTSSGQSGPGTLLRDASMAARTATPEISRIVSTPTGPREKGSNLASARIVSEFPTR
jgi:ParB-like chromosome segregation protein Spo0J